MCASARTADTGSRRRRATSSGARERRTRCASGSCRSRAGSALRILLVSQMYPGPAAPDLGVFVRQLEQELTRLGNDIARAVVDRRGGSRLRYARLARDAVAEARRFRPDVVYGHFLFPAGAAAALAARVARARLVVTAHGRDVRNFV